MRLLKEEKETILLTSEADDSWNIYTCSIDLKNKLKRFASSYPEICRLKSENSEDGSVSYLVNKSSVSVQLNPLTKKKKTKGEII